MSTSTTPTLTARQARAARLQSLLLAGHDITDPHGIVCWFGAMQAQDLASGLWSLGVRLPGSTEGEMLAALEDGVILRTWPMRGTIHLVPSEDAHWMIDLMGSRMLATGERRRANLGLTLDDVDRAVRALVGALTGGRRLTRAQALAVVNDAGVTTEGQRGYHVLWYASQAGVTCIGPQVEGEQTFVLLDEWVPKPCTLTSREGAAELAFRYFRSHGPASVRDFSGWTGLGLGVTRTAIADNDGRLVHVQVDGVDSWLSAEVADHLPTGPARAPAVLPGFDEFLLGYKDRALVIPEGRFDAIVPGGNGVFRATVVIDGTAAATWTRTLTPRAVTITVQPFEAWTPTRREDVARAFAPYGEFLGREAVVSFADPL